MSVYDIQMTSGWDFNAWQLNGQVLHGPKSQKDCYKNGNMYIHVTVICTLKM